MQSTADKRASLAARIDWSRPALGAAAAAPHPVDAFVEYLRAPGRARFRFEPERKDEILAFLRANYDAWREFDTRAAQRFVDMPIAAAKGARALSGIAALGQAWWATGEPRYGAAFARFYTRVPTGEMFNWGSFNGSQGALELDAYFLLRDCPGFSTDGRIAYLDHLCAITEEAWDVHTSSWPQSMLGPEGHNWYLHGMHVLPFFALLFPEFKRSAFFLRTGWSVVEEHLRGHYKADGGARETTLGYQAGSLQCLWDFYLMAHRNGHPMSVGFVDHLLRATRFLLRLMSPQGGMPSFGDGGHGAGGLTRLAATATALTGDGECKWYAERCRRNGAPPVAGDAAQIPLCAFWGVGLTGAAAYVATKPRNPEHVSVLMGPTGYAAMRDTDTADARYLAVAAAERGPIVTSHGHNDIFAVEVHADGVRYLGEMGCAPYGDSPGREYDQTTAAHNCLAVDGREQAALLGEWRWSQCVTPAVRRWISEPTHDIFHGVHEGFYRWPDSQVLHARKIIFIKARPSYWLICDWLESNVENTYAAYFHGCMPAAADGARVILNGAAGARLMVAPPADDDLTPVLVDEPGLAAYRREKELDAQQTPCYVYRTRAASAALVWVLVPLAPGAAPPVVNRLAVSANGTERPPCEVTGVRVDFGDTVDRICLSHLDWDADLAWDTGEDWGIFAFRRATADADVLRLTHTVCDGTCGR